MDAAHALDSLALTGTDDQCVLDSHAAIIWQYT